MSVQEETRRLRMHLRRLAREARKDRLPRRYALVYRPKQPVSMYRRARIKLGAVLRRLGLRRPMYAEAWLPVLAHAEHDEDAKPLLIWALGADRDTLRKACTGLQRVRASVPGFVPVLVTDVADFAFFSRLGWLVEYVPTLSPPAGGYGERKQRYLAWLYRDAPALPVSAGLADDAVIVQAMTWPAADSKGRL